MTVGARRSRGVADLVAPQRVAGVDADADDVAGLDGGGVDRVERFVHDDGIAELGWRRRRDDIQPARRNNADAERDVAWVDEMNSHRVSLSAADSAHQPTLNCLQMSLGGLINLGGHTRLPLNGWTRAPVARTLRSTHFPVRRPHPRRPRATAGDRERCRRCLDPRRSCRLAMQLSEPWLRSAAPS